MATTLVVLNGYVHWRILKGRPITRNYVFALSAMDLATITAGVAITSAFANSFFVLYYPALLIFALVAPSRRLTFTVLILVAAAYAGVR